MLALSSPVSSNLGWFTEDPMFSSHGLNNICAETKWLESTSFGENGTSSNSTKAKKLSHNASERNRRQKMNFLYSSLRSLLPDFDERKKLSIPNTVSLVVKYIPELRKEVERLIQRKEELLSKKSRQLGDFIFHENSRDGSTRSTSLASDGCRRPVGNGEILIQMFSAEAYKRNLLSEALKEVEKNGMVLLNASAFQSAGLMFYSLHLKDQGNPKLDLELLKDKLMLLFREIDRTFVTIHIFDI